MGVSHPPKDETRIMISQLPVPSEFGILEGMVPESEGVKEKDPNGLVNLLPGSITLANHVASSLKMRPADDPCQKMP